MFDAILYLTLQNDMFQENNAGLHIVGIVLTFLDTENFDFSPGLRVLNISHQWKMSSQRL